jgi:YHS domain-containing protein
MTRFILITTLLTTFSFAAEAQMTAQRQQHFNTGKQHLALEGYDPVSYFTGKPLKGKKEISYDYAGVRYQFSSATNRDAFKANPAKYEPAYGGWCAYAMAVKGEKVDVDPLTYRIANGQLLLFYNQFFTNTLESWKALKTPENELIKTAGQHWNNILKP